ncbi:MAG: alpha/beta hydrolase [Spirochaetaceae bacterium]|jgi:fermentation-respiration switch protein FrsA (DUF1100 family)|nr:alpha/beta hydrolase [Spirochaetaceae bacterium]
MKIALIITAIIIFLLLILALTGNYFFDFALKRKKKVFLADNPDIPSYESPLYDGVNEWAESIPHEIVSITSFDGLKLVGTKFLQSDTAQDKSPWIIAVHGYTGKHTDMLDRTRLFYNAGYNVLIPDCRAHGDSEGSVITMGWLDRLDLKAWCEKLAKDYPACKIALYGVSMGAATVMMASGEALPDNVRCIIEDCGYTSVWDIMEYQFKKMFHLPAFPIMQASNVVVRLRVGFDMKEASAIEQLKKTSLPILFIHGDADNFVPFQMLEPLYEAKTKGFKDKLIVPGAMHGNALHTDPEGYMEKLLSFLNHTLL